MKKLILIAVFFGCFSVLAGSEVFPVEFIKIGESQWIHRSYDLVAGYKYPSNGLIVETRDSVVLIDTAWNNEETQQILDFTKKTIGKPVAGCLITHFHQDRAGGLKAVTEKNIPVYMTALTASLLKKTYGNFDFTELKNGNLNIAGMKMEVQYFGPAHSPDNIIVWLPDSGVLFGGCLVKSLDSNTIGNTADADLKNWPAVIRKVQASYGQAKLVIPGHGQPGSTELLRHTAELLKTE